MKRLLILFCFTLSLSFVMAMPKLSAQLDSAKILIGQRAYLKITVEADKTDKVSLPDFKVQQEITDGVEVLNAHKQTTEEGQTKKYTATYILTGWEEKEYKIPALPVVVNGNKMFTKEFTLRVKGVPVNKKQAVAKPADDIFDIPFNWTDLLPALVCFLFAVLCACFAYIFKRRIQQGNFLSLSVKKQVKRSPYEEAIDSIKALKTDFADENGQKLYYAGVADVLRSYISKQFKCNALEKTSDEIIAEIANDVSGELTRELQMIFQTADLVKFAKYKVADEDKEEYLSKVYDFLEATKIVEAEEEEKGEEKSEKDSSVKQFGGIKKAFVLALYCLSALLLGYAAFSAYQVIM